MTAARVRRPENHVSFARPTHAAACRRLAATCLLLGVALPLHAADGDPDPTFSGDGRVEVEFAGGSIDDAKVAVDAAGRVLVAGTITRTGPNRDFAVSRLTAAGALDTTFGFQGRRTAGFDLVENGSDRVTGVFPQADGTVLLLGVAEVADQIVARSPPAILRLTAAGNADPSFGTDGRVVVGGHPWTNPGLHLTQSTQQRDGKILFGGYCTNCPDTYRAVVVRLTANGVLDPSFGSAGWSSIPLSVVNPRFEAMQVDDLGRIVLVGAYSSNGAYRPLVVRMTATGAADPGFGAGSGSVTIPELPSPFFENAGARAVAIDRDHSMILAIGNFTGSNLTAGLVRILADGARDALYAGNGLRNLTLEQGSRILALALRSDRRLVAAGWINPDGGGQDFLLARVLPGGGLDNGFDGNGLLRFAFNETNADGADAMTLAAGKPVIAGYTYSTQRNIGVVRLQSDLIFSNGIE